MLFRNYLLFPINFAFLCVLIFWIGSSLDAHEELMIIKPSSIELSLSQDQIKNSPPFSFQITSNRNLTNITASLSDLRQTHTPTIWHDGKSIPIIPNPFNISANKVTNVALLLANMNNTGDFQGDLTLYSAEGVLRTIPIRITVFPDINIQLLAIAFGVVASLMLKMWQFDMRSRNEAIMAFERVRRAASGAHRGKRLDGEYELGILEFNRASKAIERRDYEATVRICDVATEHFHAAREGGESPVQSPMLSGEQILDIISGIRDHRMPFREYIKKAKTLAFILVTILTLALIMQTWTQLLAQPTSVSIGYFTGIYAFLLGFGSQSIVGELFDILGRRR